MTTSGLSVFGLRVVLLVAVFVGGAPVAAADYEWLAKHRGKAGIEGCYAKQYQQYQQY